MMKMEPNEILRRLKEGNDRFVADKLEGKLQDSLRREELSTGQAPQAIILGCADSRVVPELIFDAGLGELFVVRVAGNIANPSSIASMEYAVAHCGSKLIVVLSHQSCGAVAAAIERGEHGTNLNHLLSHIKPALDALPIGTNPDEIAKKNAQLTAIELTKKSEIITTAVKNNEVEIVSAFYNLSTGQVEFLK